MAAYEVLLLNTAIPQIQAAQAGDTYVVPRDIAFSTVASLAAGTEALPSLVATGDVNTGFWFPAADTIAASTGGTRRLTLDASGNLGIGTSSPGYKLTVSGGATSLAANQYLRFGAAPFAAGDGSLTNYLFSGSTSLTWRNAADSSDLMYLSNSGNLGIGTSSPSSFAGYTTVSVNNATNGGIYNILVNGTETARLQAFSGVFNVSAKGASTVLTFETNGSERMRLDASGNLGLGVTPSAWSAYRAFQMQAGSLLSFSTNDWRMVQNVVRTGTNFDYLNNGRAHMYLQDGSSGGHIWYTAPSGTAGDTIGFTQAMTLDDSGNLGVGNTSPSAFGKFVVSSSGTPTVAYASIIVPTVTYNTPFESTLYMGLGRTDPANNGVPVGYRLKTYGADANGAYFAIESASSNPNSSSPPSTFTERARITSDGRLLVGTSSSAGTLTVDAVDVLSTGNVGTYAISCGNDANNALAFGSNASNSYVQSFGGRYLVINEQGNEVLIAGTTDNGAYNLQCNGTGVWGAGAYVNGSDARLKEEVATIDSALDVVTALRPVTFRYKESHSKDQSIQPGFIAQELQAAMAEKSYVDGIVQAGPEYLNVAYQSLIPLLTKAIQEQQAMINELKAEVAALKGA